MHALGVAHDNPAMVSSAGSFGPQPDTLRADHRLPFQRSARTLICVAATAMQNFTVGHATASRPTPIFELGCRDQRVPFQRSTNATPFTAPTAVHASGEEHERAVSELAAAGPGDLR
jgi:hypothetical protein